MRGEWKAMPKRSMPKTPSARNKPKAKKAMKRVQGAMSRRSNRSTRSRGGRY